MHPVPHRLDENEKKRLLAYLPFQQPSRPSRIVACLLEVSSGFARSRITAAQPRPTPTDFRTLLNHFFSQRTGCKIANLSVMSKSFSGYPSNAGVMRGGAGAPMLRSAASRFVRRLADYAGQVAGQAAHAFPRITEAFLFRDIRRFCRADALRSCASQIYLGLWRAPAFAL